jgi:hypothetical protein
MKKDFDQSKFEKDINDLLDKFQIFGDHRREIFSLLVNPAALKPQKSTEKAIPNDKTSESSESDA